MTEKIKAPITVLSLYDHRKRSFTPKRVLWEGKNYNVTKVGLHHTYFSGRTLIHVFSVDTETLFFRLSFDTSNLNWSLEEISDGD